MLVAVGQTRTVEFIADNPGGLGYRTRAANPVASQFTICCNLLLRRNTCPNPLPYAHLGCITRSSTSERVNTYVGALGARLRVEK